MHLEEQEAGGGDGEHTVHCAKAAEICWISSTVFTFSAFRVSVILLRVQVRSSNSFPASGSSSMDRSYWGVKPGRVSTRIRLFWRMMSWAEITSSLHSVPPCLGFCPEGELMSWFFSRTSSVSLVVSKQLSEQPYA